MNIKYLNNNSKYNIFNEKEYLIQTPGNDTNDYMKNNFNNTFLYNPMKDEIDKHHNLKKNYFENEKKEKTNF